jgi:hypothetical protein
MIFDRPWKGYVQGERGSTLLVRKNRNISIRNGQFLLGTQLASMSFATSATSTLLPARAIALVSSKGNQVRITLLDSGSASSVPVRLANSSLVTLKPNEELLVTTYPAVSTKSGVRYQTTKTAINPQTLLTRNVLFNCTSVRITHRWPYEQLFRRSEIRVAAPAPKAASPIVPIAYPSVTPPDSSMSEHATMRKISEGHFFLSTGTVMARAKEPMTVDTPQGSIEIKQDAIAIISVQNKLTRVMNLIDHHRNGVVANTAGKSLELGAGREAVFVDAAASEIDRLVLDDGIGHKNMKIIQIDENHGLITGQFSMGDLITRHPLLQRLRKSEDKSDRDLVNALIKTAAAEASMGN